MPNRPTVAMRLEPHMLPSLIAAYDRAALDVAALLIDVRTRARLPRPWTTDHVSTAMFDHYNEQVIDGRHSTYAALRTYEQELRNIRDKLRLMKVEYDRTETDAATLMGRL